jgi:PKD repeat protein
MCIGVLLHGAAYFMLISCQSQAPVPSISASFRVQPAIATPGQPVQFTDTSTGIPTSWQWDFGDGGIASTQNPVHTYAAQGSYAATLTVANTASSSSITNPILVEQGEVYWVSPTGTAAWASAKSTSALDGTAAASLATANANVKAGDTVVLRGGTYSTSIQPSNSGTDASNRITYAAYAGETPIITGSNSFGTFVGIDIEGGKSYIKVMGMTIQNVDRWMMILNGCSYIEICYNKFAPTAGVEGLEYWNAGPGGSPCSNLWFHHNVIHDFGYINSSGGCGGGAMQIGIPGYDNVSNHNTIENNIWYHCGHHCLESYTQYNVIKNNFFRNDPFMTPPAGVTPSYPPDTNGKWGHRNIQIYCDSSINGGWSQLLNLVEGNRFGRPGQPPDNDGGDGLTICASYNIIRFNDIFAAQNNGVLMKTGASNMNESANYNRFFNNTIYASGQYRPPSGLWEGYNFRWYGSYVRTGNVIINNLMYQYGGQYDLDPTQTGVNRIENNWLTANGDPKFTNPDISNWASMTLPDLTLQSNSPCIGGGMPLTKTTNSGSGSTTLTVNDPYFFQDGTWGSALTHGVTLFPDWIAVGSASNVVQISSINYTTNTIILATPISWNNNAPVWLYKNSSGERVLNGTAPNLGAH